jgi:hypothetical protein
MVQVFFFFFNFDGGLALFYAGNFDDGNRLGTSVRHIFSVKRYLKTLFMMIL